MNILTKVGNWWMGLWTGRTQNEVPATVGAQEILAPMEFEISLKREDRPEFTRTYKATIPGGFRVEFTFYFDMFGQRSDRYATLTQRNGNYILFDPNRVAEQIIDRDLAPKVQLLSDRVLHLDRQFANNTPTEYLDKSGARWVRTDCVCVLT